MKSVMVALVCLMLAHGTIGCKKLLKEPIILCLQAPAPPLPSNPCATVPLPPSPCAPAPLPAVTLGTLDMSCLMSALVSALPSALVSCAKCNPPPSYAVPALPCSCFL